MNNANCGYDCRSNIDNRQFVPIFDELRAVTYLKKYYNYFDLKIKDFMTCDLIKENIDEEYNNALTRSSKDDKFCNIKLSSIETQRNKSVESLESLNI